MWSCMRHGRPPGRRSIAGTSSQTKTQGVIPLLLPPLHIIMLIRNWSRRVWRGLHRHRRVWHLWWRDHPAAESAAAGAPRGRHAGPVKALHGRQLLVAYRTATCKQLPLQIIDPLPQPLDLHPLHLDLTLCILCARAANGPAETLFLSLGLRCRLQHLDLTAQLIDLFDQDHILVHDAVCVRLVGVCVLNQLALERLHCLLKVVTLAVVFLLQVLLHLLCVAHLFLDMLLVQFLDRLLQRLGVLYDVG
mmetsp:Transcript_51691/g.86142  ORF Transcript_51691/g.86142 Transcript_51691/m.86142 type:complete len:248 (-) Transcript_51691:3163-3906(-)